MDTVKVLYISQEITPYLPENEVANMSRYLPQAIQEKGREIRTFMPRFGCVNERRNQLHEVIRLSGMNLIIDDTDHPLIIKVASIQSARMQVYFIDNDDLFHRKFTVADESGVESDLFRQEEIEWLNEHVKLLSERRRLVVEEIRKGTEREEIARQLGCTPGAVYKLYYDAIKALTEMLNADMATA